MKAPRSTILWLLFGRPGLDTFFSSPRKMTGGAWTRLEEPVSSYYVQSRCLLWLNWLAVVAGRTKRSAFACWWDHRCRALVNPNRQKNENSGQRYTQSHLVRTTVNVLVKFVYSEKATKFGEISTLLLSTVHTDKCKVEISQIFCGLLRIYELYK